MQTRGLWWNVDNLPHFKEIFYFFFFLSLVSFFYGYFLKIKNWSRGKNKNNFKVSFNTIIDFFSNTFLHKSWGKKDLAFYAHILVFISFFSLWIGTDILTVQEKLPIYFFEGIFYKLYSFTMDLCGVLLFLGCVIFGFIRYKLKPKRLDNFQNDYIQILFLETFVILGFSIEGLRQSTNNQIELYAPVGAMFAYLFKNFSYDFQIKLHFIFWWLHSLQTFLFIGLIPYTKMSHMFVAPINLFFSNKKANSKLSTPFNLVELMAMENPPENIEEGVSKIEDFSWKDLLDLDACTACGRCQEMCPATNSEKPLSPKFLILDLRQTMLNKPLYEHQYSSRKEGSQTLPDIIGQETLFSCTSCNACVEACPVGVNQLSKIIELRRTLIKENKAPMNLLNTLRNIRNKFNPWGQQQDDREKWMEGLDVPKVDSCEFEYLYWVGCAGAYDSRNQNVARSMVNILKKAEVKFAVLGKLEKCTGDTARRAGDEGLFQELAIENIETFKSKNVKKIITHCPHCFNTLKNEYPEFGLKDVQVLHHTDVLWSLIYQGKISLTKEINEQITYHDSCYLGRHNGKYSAVRNILGKIPGLKYTEMENSKEKGTCCGGGGAQLWYEAPGKQVNVMRLEEIKASKSNTVTTACPFCTIMLETAKTIDKDNSPIVVKDISEIVSENM